MTIYPEIVLLEQQITSKILYFFSFTNTVILIASIVTLVYLIYKIVKRIKIRNYQIRRRQDSINYHLSKINGLLKPDWNHEIKQEDRIREMKEELNEIKGIGELTEESNRLKKEIKKEECDLIEWEHQKKIWRLNAENEELEKKKRMLIMELEDDKSFTLENLDIENNRVFKKDNLSKKEYQTLIENGFKQVNEYCLLEKKRISILAKPFGNHTISHEFLVWSAKRLIKKIRGIKKIQEHLTRDADITFIFNNRTYALEIETGKLLGKHNQLKEKINYLNKKYPKRWMFIVSHRSFLGKYGKFGLTSDRSRMSEKLAKMLQISHT